MSRILRRPMFRGGGKVSSYNKGIASGLGYMGGGQIGGGSIAGEYFPDGRYGFQNPRLVNLGGGSKVPTKSVVNQGGNILTRNLNKAKSGIGSARGILSKWLQPGTFSGSMQSGADIVGKAGTKIVDAGGKIIKTGANIVPKSAGFATGILSKAAPWAALYEVGAQQKELYDLNKPRTVEALAYMKSMNQTGVLDETAMPEDTEAYFQELDRLNKEGTPLEEVDAGYTTNQEDLNIIIEEQTKKKKDKALEAAENDPNKEITVDIKTGEPVLSRKEKLKKKADEYQEILGEGIKKDSIFDAMVEGGSRLLEGEGWGAAARAANKSLDPIQNIKTASRKLALEEDIALRKAIATGAAKTTDMSRKIAALKAGGYSPEQIANAVAGIKPETLGEKVSKLGKVDGYAEYVKENMDIQSVVSSKTDLSGLPKGKYYIADKFTIVEIDENGKLVPGSKQVLKQS